MPCADYAHMLALQTSGWTGFGALICRAAAQRPPKPVCRAQVDANRRSTAICYRHAALVRTLHLGGELART